MKFFSWMQNKINGGGHVQSNSNKKPDTFPVPVPVPPPAALYDDQRSREKTEEEVGNYPHGLLTIGTLGNQEIPAPENQRPPTSPETEIHQAEVEAFSQDLAEFTPEEVGKLQKALKKLLKKKQKIEVSENNANNDLPLDRFLNCPSSLTVDRSVSSRYSTNSSSIIEKYHDEEDNIDRTIRVIIERCKQVSLENKKKGIFGKKSVSFLLKKMFVCSSGFNPAPSLRDTMQESRMEKLLRTMLSKKMYPQNASRASSTKRILEGARFSIKGADKKQEHEDDDEQQTQESKNEACKWVKTDSEYIVLDLD